jgi:hypothetical protein
MHVARKAPSRRVSTIMGRLRRRVAKAVVRLLILSHSNAKTAKPGLLARLRLKTSRGRALPIFACSQPILVETRSAKDWIRGSLAQITLSPGAWRACAAKCADAFADSSRWR